MKINIYAIAKQTKDDYDKLASSLDKMSQKYASVNYVPIFNNKIAKAQDIDEIKSQQEYEYVFEPYIQKGYNIALNPSSKIVDSFEFSKLLEDKIQVNFFIGGAYGFNDSFIKKCHKNISFTNLTLSHKIARLVLHEQIYRGLSIISNHPYHK